METPDELRARASRYRLMASQTTDWQLIDALNTLADEYEKIARQAECGCSKPELGDLDGH